MKKIIITLFVFACTSAAMAQKAKTWSLSINGGIASPSGNYAKTDYNDNSSGFSKTGFHFNVSALYHVTRSFGINAVVGVSQYGHAGLLNLADGYDVTDREKKLSDGFKFGNLGKDGIDKIISMATQISGNRSASVVFKSLESIPTDILRDFFSKNENTKNLFSWAREFEAIGFNKEFIHPGRLDPALKSILSVLLDFFGLERRKFFDLFPKVVQAINPAANVSGTEIKTDD